MNSVCSSSSTTSPSPESPVVRFNHVMMGLGKEPGLMAHSRDTHCRLSVVVDSITATTSLVGWPSSYPYKIYKDDVHQQIEDSSAQAKHPHLHLRAMEAVALWLRMVPKSLEAVQ